ncbi:MAG: tRNA preQ1(34) S-adenosylmethionine ribosyltransferase-isomerase QueA [Actinobacteria bacterium]|nr:tRNA preQ1(34) S-adenosylmethionine ribosyltransferase-isomerase QueA [Actinomycetota bacterium]
MRTSDFDYGLPPELIAQEPAEPRDSSRLLVIDRVGGRLEHKTFRDIADYVEAGDCLVVNDTKVIPARLKGEKAGTGGKAEIFLLHDTGDGLWEALVKPGRRLAPGAKVSVAGGLIEATVVKRLPGGERLVSLEYEGDFEDVLAQAGEVPLPPYIEKPIETIERYQTVYANRPGSVAAPTAGLHFTPELLGALAEKGVKVAAVTLRVGLDTFRPVREDEVEAHEMHSEFYSVMAEAAEVVNETKAAGKRVIAVGTTSVRVLESAGATGALVAGSGDTRLFIYPGYNFNMVDAMITNFHLPKSTLLMLVSAFAGKDLMAEAYREAVAERYRFYSFGDAMLIF